MLLGGETTRPVGEVGDPRPAWHSRLDMARIKALLLLFLVLIASSSFADASSSNTSASSSSTATTVVTIDSDAPTTRTPTAARSLPVHTRKTDTGDSGGSAGLSGGVIAGLVIGCVAVVGVGVAVTIRGRFTAQRGDEALFADLGDDNVYFSDYAAM